MLFYYLFVFNFGYKLGMVFFDLGFFYLEKGGVNGRFVFLREFLERTVF